MDPKTPKTGEPTEGTQDETVEVRVPKEVATSEKSASIKAALNEIFNATKLPEASSRKANIIQIVDTSK